MSRLPAPELRSRCVVDVFNDYGEIPAGTPPRRSRLERTTRADRRHLPKSRIPEPAKTASRNERVAARATLEVRRNQRALATLGYDVGDEAAAISEDLAALAAFRRDKDVPGRGG